MVAHRSGLDLTRDIALERVRDGFLAAIAAQRFGAIILDTQGSWLLETIELIFLPEGLRTVAAR